MTDPNRTSYNTAIANAGKTQQTSLQANEQSKQVSIDAQRSVVGLNLQNGNSALVTAIANANAAKVAGPRAWLVR